MFASSEYGPLEGIPYIKVARALCHVLFRVFLFVAEHRRSQSLKQRAAATLELLKEVAKLLVNGLGADEVFDYRDETVVEKIRAATGNTLDIRDRGQGQKGGIILPYESPRPDVNVKFSMAPDLLKHVRLSCKLNTVFAHTNSRS